jgi:gas vesicle protein
MGNFLLGFGIGVTMGVLFAPKSGSETRRYLADKANESSDFLMQQGQQIKSTASDLMDKGREMVMNQKDKVSDMMGQSSSQPQPQYQR